MVRLGHRPALDGIRALAIVGVMGLHATVLHGGFFGVDVFFVLSAFLISTLILEELDDRSGHFGALSFYTRRVLRLGPALLVWLVLIAAPTAIALHQTSSIPISTIASLAYFGNYAITAHLNIGDGYRHIWSLAVEEQFYLVWPAVLLVLYRRRLGTPLCAAAGAVFFVTVGFISMRTLAWSYDLPTGHVVPLGAGVLAAYGFRATSSFGRRARLESIGAWASLCLLAVVFAVPTFGNPALAGAGPDHDMEFVIQVLVSVATAYLILYLCTQEGDSASRLLTNPVALWLGRRSYGIYLYHFTLVTLVAVVLFPDTPLRFTAPIALLASCLVAELSYRHIERPINRAGRSWLRRREDAPIKDAEFALPIVSARPEVESSPATLQVASSPKARGAPWPPTAEASPHIPPGTPDGQTHVSPT